MRVTAVALALLSSPALAAQPSLSMVPVADGLGRVVALTHAGDGSARLFLIQQTGEVLVLEEGVVLPTPFLNLSSLVPGAGGERGLLSVAFHPDYAENGFFFVNYTDLSGDTVVARYAVSPTDRNRADPGSGHTILTQEQPFPNHNGGQLQFGPDGRLFIGMGDGGSGNDPQGNGQNPGTLLGKLLRIDVDAGDPYAIPDDNPFIEDPATLPEIWALGLRNPWRFSFDRITGDLFIADVGQSSREEVNFEPAGSPGGRNYGWVDMEGSICRLPPGGCDGFTAPILEYDHSQGCSITGGYRYRGLRFPSLGGFYLYGDYCSGRIWGGRSAPGGIWTTWELLDTNLQISTFGEDEEGTLYVAGVDGRLLRLEAEPFVKGDVDGDGRADLFWQNFLSGAMGVWLMDGLAVEEVHVFAEQLSDTSWRLVGTHDFDRDGQTDLLWQHLSQGWLALALLDGVNPTASVLLDPGREAELDWRVVGTGDLDLDGQPDLVWRNLADGRLRVWLMDDWVRREEIVLFDGAPLDLGWRVAAVEDLSRDGRLDVLFQHESQGWLAVWLMAGTRPVEARLLTPAVVNPDWQIVGSGDLLGDGGTADLFWRQRVNGSIATTSLWGSVIVGGASLSPAAVPDLSWLLLGPR